MAYRLRHEGSPRAVENMTLAQVVEGLSDGKWQATDEVQAPGEKAWTKLEDHPQFAEVVAELEAAEHEHRHEEPTEIDMVPLIDVCMVLLVFFILTTSYQALEKILSMPSASAENVGAPVVTQEQVDRFMIKVEARVEADGKPGIYVEGQKVQREEDLVGVLGRYAKDNKKNELLLQASDKVSWETITKIIDAAAGARVAKVHYLIGGGAP